MPSTMATEQYKLMEEYDGFGLYKSVRRNAWTISNEDITVVFNNIDDLEELYTLIENYNQNKKFGIKVIPKEVNGFAFNISHEKGSKDI